MLTDEEIGELLGEEFKPAYSGDREEYHVIAKAQEKDTLKKVRELFLKYLTEDSKTQDVRRRDFNQAIFFDPDNKHFGGHQIFNGTDLDMVIEKFDKAINALKRGDTRGG